MLVVAALVTAGCTKTAVITAPPSAAAPPLPGISPVSPSLPTPTPVGPTEGGQVQRPPLTAARVVGTYKVVYVTLSANVSGVEKRERRTWFITPVCQEGACDVMVESHWRKLPSPRWRAGASYARRHYRFTREEPKAYTCGDLYAIPAVISYGFGVTDMALVGGHWVATRIRGELRSEGTRGCGQGGRPEERRAIRGFLVKGSISTGTPAAVVPSVAPPVPPPSPRLTSAAAAPLAGVTSEGRDARCGRRQPVPHSARLPARSVRAVPARNRPMSTATSQ